MTTYLPRPTEAAIAIAQVSLVSDWRAPKAFTEAELQATEDALDLAYQKSLQGRVYDYVNKVDRVCATMRPVRRRAA